MAQRVSGTNQKNARHEFSPASVQRSIDLAIKNSETHQQGRAPCVQPAALAGAASNQRQRPGTQNRLIREDLASQIEELYASNWTFLNADATGEVIQEAMVKLHGPQWGMKMVSQEVAVEAPVTTQPRAPCVQPAAGAEPAASAGNLPTTRRRLDKRSRILCKFIKYPDQGKCPDGEQCPYAHDPSKVKQKRAGEEWAKAVPMRGSCSSTTGFSGWGADPHATTEIAQLRDELAAVKKELAVLQTKTAWLEVAQLKEELAALQKEKACLVVAQLRTELVALKVENARLKAEPDTMTLEATKKDELLSMVYNCFANVAESPQFMNEWKYAAQPKSELASEVLEVDLPENLELSVLQTKAAQPKASWQPRKFQQESTSGDSDREAASSTAGDTDGAGSCYKGSMCEYCHLCDEGAVKRNARLEFPRASRKGCTACSSPALEKVCNEVRAGWGSARVHLEGQTVGLIG